ncbi:MAG TPA: uroporphyrinogen-III synthase [Stellaceae bacterium]|nr:uroporphyrinogen-III synthase [Stellaceae bacterium]
MKALVTRPRDDAASLARALAERGIEAVIEPMLTIAPVAEGARQLAEQLAGVQALLFTSANGVRAFAAASVRRELPVFAVGDASAAAARLADFRSVASAGGDVADLAQLVAARLAPQNGALIHAAGTETAGDLAGALGTAGFTVRRVRLYDAVPVPALAPDTIAALRRGEIGLACFFSPRTAITFARLAAAGNVVDACRGIIAFALSAAVAAALAELPWKSLRIAAAPTQRDLLAALDDVLAARSAHPVSGGA